MTCKPRRKSILLNFPQRPERITELQQPLPLDPKSHKAAPACAVTPSQCQDSFQTFSLRTTPGKLKKSGSNRLITGCLWVYFNLGFRVSGRGVRAHRIPYRIKKGRSSRSSYFIFGTGQALAARLELLYRRFIIVFFSGTFCWLL